MTEKISDLYHRYFNDNKLWEYNTWLGVPCWKLPLDQIVYQQLITKIRPTLIIETGTCYGGSALFFASILELIGASGSGVITIDIEDKCTEIINSQHHKIQELWNKKVQFIQGNSIDSKIAQIIQDSCQFADSVMVILDSWHSKEHVLKELELYSPLVSINSYIIVEDSHIHNPIQWAYGDGPAEAIEEFLKNNSNFESDLECEKFVMTFNPFGFLKRMK